MFGNFFCSDIIWVLLLARSFCMVYTRIDSTLYHHPFFFPQKNWGLQVFLSMFYYSVDKFYNHQRLFLSFPNRWHQFQNQCQWFWRQSSCHRSPFVHRSTVNCSHLLGRVSWHQRKAANVLCYAVWKIFSLFYQHSSNWDFFEREFLGLEHQTILLFVSHESTTADYLRDETELTSGKNWH